MCENIDIIEKISTLTIVYFNYFLKSYFFPFHTYSLFLCFVYCFSVTGNKEYCCLQYINIDKRT